MLIAYVDTERFVHILKLESTLPSVFNLIIDEDGDPLNSVNPHPISIFPSVCIAIDSTFPLIVAAVSKLVSTLPSLFSLAILFLVAPLTSVKIHQISIFPSD
jgi:hypothetical protein